MDPEVFAKEWEAGWNSHDLPRILSHYDESIVFRSRKAVAISGEGTLHGIEALRAYWTEALRRQPDLCFHVQNVFAGHDMMVITYRNHRDVLAAETLYFNADGKVYRAAACHALD